MVIVGGKMEEVIMSVMVVTALIVTVDNGDDSRQPPLFLDLQVYQLDFAPNNPMKRKCLISLEAKTKNV